MTSPRPDATIGGYSVASRYGRVYLVDQLPGTDPGMTTTEARQLATALVKAADAAERRVRRIVEAIP
jgi:hypothetical protein